MTVYDLHKGSEIDVIEPPLSVALGNFDGLHPGHLSLIEKAKCSSYKCCVFTFSENPFGAKRLMTTEAKKRILAELGVDYLAVFDFDDIKDMSWQDFADEVLTGRLNCRNAVCGFNFRFGKNAEGTGALLKQYLSEKGISCHICDSVLYRGEPISSSRIRNLLSDGKIEEANELLGREYSIDIHVVHGNGIGRHLGYPTVNQRYDDRDIKLPFGVYICRCNGRPAVTNFGVRPTVTSEAVPYYETFILNYSADLYGVELKIEFLSMLRSEKRFSDYEELSGQIALDVKQTEEYFG